MPGTGVIAVLDHKINATDPEQDFHKHFLWAEMSKTRLKTKVGVVKANEDRKW